MNNEPKFLRRLVDLLGHRQQINIHGLVGSAFSYIAGQVWRGQGRPLLVVTATSSDAEKFCDDLNFFCAGSNPGSISVFSAPESLPFTHMIPQPDTWIDRLKTLYELGNTENISCVVAPIEAVVRRVPPKKLFQRHTEIVSLGQRLDRDAFLKRLVIAGYNNSPLVEDEGDFASRGYLVDFWSPVSDRPLRIELDGDQVASIKAFDPTTQRTSFSVDNAVIIPVRSVVLDDDVVSSGLRNLKLASDEAGVSQVERREFAEAVRSGVYPAYLETLLPIFHTDAGLIWDYLKKDTLVFVSEPELVRRELARFWEDLNAAYNESTHIEKAVLPNKLFATCEDWQGSLEKWPTIQSSGLDILGKEASAERINVSVQSSMPPTGRWMETGQEDGLSLFAKQLAHWQKAGSNVFAVCHTPMQADRVVDILRWQGLSPEISERPFGELVNTTTSHFYVTTGTVSDGFVWEEEGIVILTEKEIFGKKKKHILRVQKLPTETFSSYQELKEGGHLVHIQHGVGRFMGMVQMEFGGMRNDFLQLEYLGGDKLYVPAYRLGLIQKYIGPGDSSPFLDRLGGTRWEKAKLKANRAVRKMAAELLKLYAMRKVNQGTSFSGRDQNMEEFEAAFPYDETPDQLGAIDDVLRDLSESYPSDRLICGDVGYGKTEVAIRAAFRVAMDGAQVAVLVPTTILAFQHFENFIERFKKTAINIELLNRFRSPREQKEVIKGLKDGSVDIVIGTHRLLQPDVIYKNLGLLVVDEEHRFGVRQKETIKKIKTIVDVLSMSATPIPRTLHTSLVGVRDISVINTPPADRRSIRTYVAAFDEGLIRGAVLKELRRNGQVFFVHNRVETIESMKNRLEKLVPEVRICVGHGQMNEHELEQVMVDFLKRKYDMLLCTSIIESGLDIPTANTIIVNRADTFGLAQLYQIRGRVGRSSMQAYAYLLIPDEASITADALKRLAALQRYTELGSGFQIAMHDLEIRGSGNILGAEQSGHISAIGYELYTELLEKEIMKLKGEQDIRRIDTEIQIPVEAFIPGDYISDSGIRIVFYKRISALKSEDDIFDMERELSDRYGPLPDETINLLKVIGIRIRAAGLGIDSVQLSGNLFVYRFSEITPLSVQKLIELIRKNQDRMKITAQSSVVISEKRPAEKESFSIINRHLDLFGTII